MKEVQEGMVLLEGLYGRERHYNSLSLIYFNSMSYSQKYIDLLQPVNVLSLNTIEVKKTKPNDQAYVSAQNISSEQFC